MPGFFRVVEKKQRIVFSPAQIKNLKLVFWHYRIFLFDQNQRLKLASFSFPEDIIKFTILQ